MCSPSRSLASLHKNKAAFFVSPAIVPSHDSFTNVESQSCEHWQGETMRNDTIDDISVSRRPSFAVVASNTAPLGYQNWWPLLYAVKQNIYEKVHQTQFRLL